MILRIDSVVQNNMINVELRSGGNVLACVSTKANGRHAEKILPAIQKATKKTHSGIKGVTGIEVQNTGGSFTSLRIGIITANALAYAFGLPVKPFYGEAIAVKKRGLSFVEPVYDRGPNITKQKPLLKN